MVDPPGEPVIKKGCPPWRTIVGVIDESGAFLDSTLLASEPTSPKKFGNPGLIEKSSIS